MKKDWAQTASAFHRFLTWLDEGVDSHGEKYLEMRRRLVSYFSRKRCLSPDELADETLTRVARRLKEEGTTFENVLDGLRHTMAVNYLSGKKVSVNETAYLTGFSEPAAFSRAFKRWTGTSPRTLHARA